jgi:hypothetical protein
MRTIQLTNQSSAADELLLFMLHPEDEIARRRAYIVGNVHRLTHLTKSMDAGVLTLSVDTVLELLDAPRYEDILEHQRSLTRDGMIAGDILATLYVMHRFNLKPSVNRAIFVVTESARGAKYHDGAPVQAAEQRARDCWSRFRSIAPVWAALRLNRDYPFVAGEELLTPGAIGGILSVAAGIRDFGTTFMPPAPRKEKRVPLLDPDTTWQMPEGVLPAILNSDDDPRALKEVLRKYGKRRSSSGT